jgi:hypothetical protein
VLQHAHALVEGLLHVGDSVLQVLHLGLQLHHVFVDAPSWCHAGSEHGQQSQHERVSLYFHNPCTSLPASRRLSRGRPALANVPHKDNPIYF